MTNYLIRLREIIKIENARAILAVLGLILITAEAMYALKNSEISLLPGYPGGEWIRPDDPVVLHAYSNPNTAAIFRKRFATLEPQQDMIIAVTSFRNLKAISLNGIQLDFSTPASWKDQIHVEVPSRLLLPGINEFRFTVINRMAPPLIHVSSTLRGFWSENDWEESTLDGIEWRKTIRADEQKKPLLKESFPSVLKGLQVSLQYVLPLIIVILLLPKIKPDFCKRITAPESVRLLLFILLSILGINNMFKLGNNFTNWGFDVRAHMEYISYILENHRIPLASEGWQMFQPPLYYTVSASLLLLFRPFVPTQYAPFILGIFSICCLLFLVEISYRLLREIIPDNKHLQSCGLFVGGLLPMNLYMCQFIGNEPLTAVLTALLLYRTAKLLKSEKYIHMNNMIVLGIIAGLAILSKVTPLILIPIVCIFTLIVPRMDKPRTFSQVKSTVVFIFTTFIVSGWFFIRNWIILGKPFYGGWDTARKIIWWQDPGYRIFKDYYSFGEVFIQPVYSGFNSFADALYSTFWGDGYCIFLGWNYDFLAAGIAFSVVPALSMATGVTIAYWRTVKQEYLPLTFLLVSIGVYVAAIIHLYTSLPIFSTVKASYTMGLTPIYAVMVALGSDLLINKKYVGSLFVSLLASWGILTYLGFFII